MTEPTYAAGQFAGKQYLFASDFDKTLSFNDSGYVLSELLGIPLEEFERKATGMANLNLVQQGASFLTCCCTTPSSIRACAATTCMRPAGASG